MNQENLIQKTEKFVRDRLQNQSVGHDYWHAVRVRNNARLISEKMENVDSLVVELAALLDSVGDYKVLDTENDDSSIARDFLKKQKLPKETTAKIMFIIENMSFGKNVDSRHNRNLPIEFQIVQDANYLDSIGAIGIARCFAFGGKRGRPLYDPNYRPIQNLTREQYVKDGGSSLAHFDEKLFKLKDMMNTDAARKIAEQRDRFMRDFYEEFLREWGGEV